MLERACLAGPQPVSGLIGHFRAHRGKTVTEGVGRKASSGERWSRRPRACLCLSGTFQAWAQRAGAANVGPVCCAFQGACYPTSSVGVTRGWAQWWGVCGKEGGWSRMSVAGYSTFYHSAPNLRDFCSSWTQKVLLPPSPSPA